MNVPTSAPHRRVVRGRAILAAALAIALLGCNSDDDASTSTGPADTTTAAVTEAPTTDPSVTEPSATDPVDTDAVETTDTAAPTTPGT